MFKYANIIILLAVSLVLIGLSFFVYLTPKDYEFSIFGGKKYEGTERTGDLYDITLISSNDPEPYWYPGLDKGTFDQPDIVGESAILVEINSGDVLYRKEPLKRMKIASLTKIMTAVLAIEHLDLTSPVTISQNAASVGENSMSLSAGEVYTVKELLYGLILHSGNDAAFALSEAAAGDPDIFVEWMNKKAFELGLKDTYFADPSGLDDSTYSTVMDLVKLTRYALKDKNFKEVVGTLEIDLASDSHKYLSLYNQTNLLSTYPGVKGVKTGFTEEAGLCLVTYAERNGKEVVGVVLRSNDRKGDMTLMLDHGFFTLGIMLQQNVLF